MTDARAESKPRGFTLLEMLVVIVITTILIGISISAFGKMRDALAPRLAAMQFLSALEAARQYSFDNSVRTRLVFSDANLPLTSEGSGMVATNSFGLYYFYVPLQPMGGTMYSSNSVGNEFSLMPILSIPSGFVGQWMPCPLAPKWQTISSRVIISATPNIFATAATNFFPTNFYTPAQSWTNVTGALTGASFYGATAPNSTYPQNYYQTPFPYAWPLITTNAPQAEPSYIYSSSAGSFLTYDKLWPTNVNYRYFNGSRSGLSPATAQFAQEVGTGGITAASRWFFDLEGMEFDTRGFPTFTGTNQITFTFAQKKNTNNYYQVVIDSTVGIPRMILNTP